MLFIGSAVRADMTNVQIKKLLSTSKAYKTLWMRILLALGTGLRRGDIESWRVSDIDFENSYVTTRSKKTRKSMGSRPVPVPMFGLDAYCVTGSKDM